MRLQVADQSAPFDPLAEGNTLRRAIRGALLSQEEVAIAVGVSGGMLSRMLRGRRPLSEDLARRIRAAIAELSGDVA